MYLKKIKTEWHSPILDVEFEPPYLATSNEERNTRWT